ncbi:hypothetical protein KFE25_002173 [Diacronema lutheri]|mgnify:CR=1 FL=1|uniref:Cupin domain-containing protein n=1 Tax=Diacronema lutheri TaxID=2081491 RepID=A0A8J6C9E2_DIALT|nr:hypothetical protein KFE25_002173 [Diacronema lutheri]
MGVRIVGSATRVVDADGLTIDELAGNVASGSDTISIAIVNAKAGTSEPWLTLAYDEWIAVREGKVVISLVGEETVEVPAGKTVHIAPGTRFKPSFPVDTEYVPVCLPAFRPDRCAREDEDEKGEAIAHKLRALHGAGGAVETATCTPSAAEDGKPEVLYHMTTKKAWDAAKKSGTAYYPATFEADGHYTHATGVPSRLITTANHFYQDVEGVWVCVAFTRTALRDAGIHVRDEQALPVGDKQVSTEWRTWVCPHVIGGIPPKLVHKVHPMQRDGKRFVSITGVDEGAGDAAPAGAPATAPAKSKRARRA